MSRILAILICGFLVGADPLLAKTVHLDQTFPTELDLREHPANPASPSKHYMLAVAGGHIPDGTVWDEAREVGAPRDNGLAPTLILEESAIGFSVATRHGYGKPGKSDADLREQADQLMRQGAAYKNFDLPLIERGVGANAWRIYFPGTIDETTGGEWTPASVDPQNYFPEKLEEAEHLYRIAIFADPYNIENYRGLVRAYTERMIPLNYAGNQAVIYASGVMRFTRPLNDEISVLNGLAYDRFREAAQILIDITGPREAPVMALIDGSMNAHYSSTGDIIYDPAGRVEGLREDIEELFDVYSRAVAMQVETLTRIHRLRYLRDYGDPNDPAYNPNPVNLLIAQIDEDYLPDLDIQILYANLLANILADVYESDTHMRSDIGYARQGINAFRQLRNAMAAKRLSFISASVGTEGGSGGLNPDVIAESVYRTYGPNYVPFLNTGDGVSTIQNLAPTARQFADRSESRDAMAEGITRDYDNNVSSLRLRAEELSRSYVSELAVLCGEVDRDDGVPGKTPAITYALLAPEVLNTYPLAIRNPVNAGQIHQQWASTALAQTELEAAALDLQNLLSEMIMAQETARAISGRYHETAKLVLSNGEQVAALDLQIGEIQAQLAITIARIQAENAKKSMWGKITSGIALVGAAVLTAYTGGAAAPALMGALSYANQASDAAGNASASSKVGDAQAKAARQTARIEAQKTRMRAVEGSRIQMDNAFINDARSAEALHSMMLRAERLKLNILIAEQRLDQESAKLDALYARMQHLLDQYRRSIDVALRENPLARPDFRLTRDLRVREAEESFVKAQERAFMVVKAAQYKVNYAGNVGDLRNFLQNTLRARRGSQLVDMLLDVEATVQDWYINVGNPVTPGDTVQRKVSLRHYVVQRNLVVTLNSSGQEGDIDPSANNSIQPQPGVTPNTTTNDMIALSDAAWLAFLQSRIRSNGDLVIPFSLGLNNDNNRQSGPTPNPLFSLFEYNMRIASGIGKGVTVNIRARGFTPPSILPVLLEQRGVSYLRSKPYLFDAAVFDWVDQPNSLLAWNLLPDSGQPVTGVGFARFNGNGGSPATQFFERSPANDRWVLTIASTADFPGGAGILQNLDKITDIEILFDTESFVQP